MVATEAPLKSPDDGEVIAASLRLRRGGGRGAPRGAPAGLQGQAPLSSPCPRLRFRLCRRRRCRL
eukprot:4096497-Pyramimonas_sp.AAC.1